MTQLLFYRTLHLPSLLTLLIFMGCSSVSRLPLPPDELPMKLTEDSEKRDVWAFYAQKTKSEDIELACSAWQKLEAHQFILNELVHISLLRCAYILGVPQFQRELADELRSLKESLPTTYHAYLADQFLPLKNEIALPLDLFTELTFYSLGNLARREERVQALLDLHLLWGEQREIEDPSLVAQVERRLFSEAPRFRPFSPNLSLEDIADIARDFERVRDFDRARELYQLILNHQMADFPMKLNAHRRMATTYRLERRMSEHSEYTQKIAQFVRDSYASGPELALIQEEWFNQREAAIRSLWTRHQTTLALEQTQEFLAEDNELTDDQAAKLYWLSGLMHKELGESKEAIKNLNKATTFKIENTQLSQDVIWSYFWELKLLGQTNKAISFLNSLNLNDHSAWFQSRLLFWQGRITQNPRFFHRAIEVGPLTYYGIMAANQLNQNKRKNYLPPLNPNLPRNELVAEWEWMLFLGKDKLVENHLLQKMSKLSPRERAGYFHYTHLIDRYDLGIRLFNQLLPQLSGRELNRFRKEYLAAFLPTPWKEEISKVAHEVNLDPALLFALIRQESAFDQNARSWADAFGLMQLIPERAHMLARKHGIKEYQNFEDLYDPALNTRLGSLLLRDLMEKFDGHKVLALAAYNAGEVPVQHWYEHRFQEDVLAFIEEIPYRETRGYVQHILRNYLIYTQSQIQF